MVTLPKSVTRELLLVRIATPEGRQEAALDVVGRWSARLLQLTTTHLTAELCGEPDRINGFVAALGSIGSVTVNRTGAIALEG